MRSVCEIELWSTVQCAVFLFQWVVRWGWLGWWVGGEGSNCSTWSSSPCFPSVYIGPAPADWRTCFSRYLQYSAPGSAELSCRHQPPPRSLSRSSCRDVGLAQSRRWSSGGSSWWVDRGGPAERRTSGPCAPPADGGDQYKLDQQVGCWETWGNLSFSRH